MPLRRLDRSTVDFALAVLARGSGTSPSPMCPCAKRLQEAGRSGLCPECRADAKAAA